MLLLKSALRNILSGGTRTWLNVAVLSFTFVLIVLYNGITDGWVQESRRETILWETGNRQYWHPSYDRYDVFAIPDAHGPIPPQLRQAVQRKQLTPILVTQGAIYPQGRMQNVLLKGIDPEQTILRIPSQRLKLHNEEIEALIGKRLARTASLKPGDRVMVRWRDRNGAFDAQQIRIASIFDTKVASIDQGQLWLRLADLQRLTALEGEASFLVGSGKEGPRDDQGGWIYRDEQFLMSDLDLLLMGERIEMSIIFTVLLSIGLLALFDTQVLSIFRRQKEIGTYIALGMTPRRVSRLFTLEGTCYSLLGILFGAAWGTPLLLWIAHTGIGMPGMDEMGIAIGNVLYPIYRPQAVLFLIGVIVGLSALISYLPARKIARQNVVNALKGRII